MIGKTVGGKYQVQSGVEDGPVFAVFLAKDTASGRDVCLRFLKAPFGKEPAFHQALSRAIERTRSVSSPQLESVWRLVADEQYVFLVGDPTRGPSMAERIRKLAPFGVPVSAGLAMSLCTALEALHRVGMPHGDLTTRHVVVMANNHVRLQMAGIWEAYSASGHAPAVVLPQMAPYLAPEISAGGEPSPAADVYAVGVILYELLTGRTPYHGPTPRDFIRQHQDEVVPSVRSVNPSVPVVLDEIIRKALAKDPAERYRDASDLLADLRILNEALRFGKSVTWPLRSSTQAPSGERTTPRAVTTAAQEPGPVAPRMSAIREEEPETVTRKRRAERDVPVWLLMIMAFLFAVVVSLVGVWLFFNLNRPQTVRVPNVESMTISEARSVLGKLKLNLKVVSREPNDRIEADRVVEVNPPPGEEVREGGRVEVVLSAGSKRVELPVVRGETVDKARSILEGLNLTVDETVVDQPSNTVPFGLVIDTEPPAKRKVDRLSRIRLIVSAGVVANPEDARRAYIYSLDIKLTDLTEATRVRIDVVDAQGTRTVYDESKQPGDGIKLDVRAYGKSATFRLFYNDELKQEFEQAAPGARE